MTNLATRYAGLSLANPFIVSSSSLTNTIEKIHRCEEAGAGAVVLKSLFEEQIYEERVRAADPALGMTYHAEAADYIHQMSMDLGPEDYLGLIRGAKKAAKIPVIASLNCVSSEWWQDYALRIQKAGADALEANIGFLTHDPGAESAEIESRILAIVQGLSQGLKIPLIVKIGPFFTNPMALIRKIDRIGAAGIVLFNRFYQIDIDVDSLELRSGYLLTPREDVTLALRWVALLSGRTKLSIAGSGGIYSGEDAAKYLLAGADAVQVCSALYKHRVEHLRTMTTELSSWMQKHDLASCDKFRGKLSQSGHEDPAAWERHQYIKALVGLE